MPKLDSASRIRLQRAVEAPIRHGTTVLCLLAIYTTLLAWIALRTSPNKTEIGHMAAGLYSWQTHRFDVYSVNPPLVRTVATIPVVLCSPIYDWLMYSPAPLHRSEWSLGSAFIKANPNSSKWYFSLARWTCIPFCFFGAYVCCCLANELYGKVPSICALALWTFSPLLLGWGATMCPDVAAAALAVATIYALRRWLHCPCWDRALIVGLALGLAVLTKFTLLIFYPLIPLLWVLYRLPDYQQINSRQWFRELIQLPAVAALSVFIINVGYGFEGSFQQLGSYRFQSTMFSGCDSLDDIPVEGANRFAGTWTEVLFVPLPADMFQGIDTQRYDFERGASSYLRGQWADHGWWYYYLYALAVKEPLGAWYLFGLAIGATVFGRGFSVQWRDEMVVLIPGLVILAFVSSQNGFSVHSRYVIPALPFMFIWASKVARVFVIRPFTPGRLVMATTVILALTWSISSSLTIFPHSLSYFNELAVILPTSADQSYPTPMGKNDESTLSAVMSAGPRHLLQSNIDWGQDLFYLEEWYESHPDARLIKVAYFGGFPLDGSKIKSTGYPPIGFDKDGDRKDPTTFGPQPGWYALSVNEIYGRSRKYRYFLDHFTPVAMAGYSIYIYHISSEEANRVRRELGFE